MQDCVYHIDGTGLMLKGINSCETYCPAFPYLYSIINDSSWIPWMKVYLSN